MNISSDGILFIEKFEGKSNTPYPDLANRSTIGIGHLILPGEHFTKLTDQEILDLFHKDIEIYENSINTLVKVPLTQNQYDSLIDFTFNEGIGAFRFSTLLKLLNKGKYKEASNQFQYWNKYKDPKTGRLIPSTGLLRRRNCEALFFNGVTIKDLQDKNWLV